MTEDVFPPDPGEPQADAVTPAPQSAPASSASSAPASSSTEAVVPAPSSTQGGPYRSLYDAVAVARPAPAPSPVFGSAMWIFGVALWAFLVMGQLATAVGPEGHDFLVSEGFAVLFVLIASTVAWATALRRTLIEHPARSAFTATMRGVGMVFLASVTWLVATVLATAVGKASASNLDGWITVGLLVVSLAAVVGGRRLAGFSTSGGPRMGTTARTLWASAAVLTVLALFLLGAD